MYEALSYKCMRPEATSLRDLKLLVYAALTWRRAEASPAFLGARWQGVCCLLVYEALSYSCLRP
jgi:hypothetical protein